MAFANDLSTLILFGRSGEHQPRTDEVASEPRVHFKDPVKVTSLRYGDIPKAGASTQAAFANDPLQHYIIDTPDKKDAPQNKKANKWGNMVVLALLKRHIALTVSHGDSLIIARYATNSEEGKRRNPADAAAKLLLRAFQGLSAMLASPEQKRRKQEFAVKTEAVVQEVLGDNINDMLYVALVATAPASQGRGYAGAILDTVCAIADSQSREAYLLSSNLENTSFYNSHGFEIEGKVVLGTDNPTWTEAPVVVPLMVRKPRSVTEKGSYI